ncbi:hypothetical protein DRQ25_18505, partial [Candidatus Fermentibacteria bacterium]
MPDTIIDTTTPEVVATPPSAGPGTPDFIAAEKAQAAHDARPPDNTFPTVEEVPIDEDILLRKEELPAQYRTEIPYPSENPAGFQSFWGQVGYEIDNGLTSNLYGVMSDFANKNFDERTEAEERDYYLKAQTLAFEHNLPPTAAEDLVKGVKSIEELERKVIRMSEVMNINKSLENTSTFQAMSAGAAGFILDPINFVPGVGVYKAGAAASKVIPKVSSVLLNGTTRHTAMSFTEKAIGYAAMGAVEEAARNYPRLTNDPSYSYELYKTDVMLGAGFGGGFVAIAPAAKAAFRPVARGAKAAIDNYATSLNARMAMNTVTDAIGLTKSPEIKQTLEKGAKQINDTPSKVEKQRANVQRAQAQIDEARAQQTVQRIAKEIDV